MQASFRASVDQRLLGKVTRLFNASLADTLNELLQNARRAGASRVDVSERQGELVIRDDGAGIEDPRVLLTLGESRWSELTASNEDPAGAGVFSLSPRGAVIHSRSWDAKQGWTMTLTPKHFSGKEEVHADPFDMDPGTEIVFPLRDNELVEPVLKAAALHYPLPVTLNGEPLDRKDFLEGAVHIESWSGLRIGVFRQIGYERRSNINFHGLTLQTALPSIAEVMMSRAFSARIDVQACPDLKLVLPARKEVVEDAFFDELMEQLKRVIYRAIGEGQSHFLPHRSWVEAKKLGVDLPEAEAALWPYEPARADIDSFYRDSPTPLPVSHGGSIVDFEDEPPAHQVFAHAMEMSAPGTLLYEGCAAYRGYGWYDRLSEITGFRCLMTEGGKTAEVPLDEHAGKRQRPDEITVEVVIREPGKGNRLLTLATDVLVAGDTSAWTPPVDELDLFVTKDSGIAPEDLAALLQAAYFSPSDDSCEDSYTTQQERFEEEALQTATALLLSEEEAKSARLRHGIERDFLWLLPRGQETVITVPDGKVEIQFRPFAGQTEEANRVEAEPS